MIKNLMLLLMLLLTFLILLNAPQRVYADTAPINAVAQDYTRQIAQKCLDKWTAPKCLKTLSSNALTMATLYGEALQSSNKPKGAEYLKQHCAAATAGTKDASIPAYALKSAFTTCANAIVDINDQLNIAPDASLYQLLIIGTICLSDDQKDACNAFEARLAAFK